MCAANYCREQLQEADLIVDATYQGSRSGNAGDDPLSFLVGVSNQGGFRILGTREKPRLLVITTSMNEPDWPDNLDLENGWFTYYGDNRRPGRDLHATPRWGNTMLRDLFERAHSNRARRQEIPPVLIFKNTGTYRDVTFLGLAVPGATALPPTQDLVAIWRHSNGQRFQNYKAVLTVLNVPRLSRAWLNDIRDGNALTDNSPAEWVAWINGGEPAALRSLPTIAHRTKEQQLPQAAPEINMLAAIYNWFRTDPHGFEACASRIAEMLLSGIVDVDLTRRSRDGGRDAFGKYRIGIDTIAIDVEFSLEAKCYGTDSSVGVKDTSRLISRLRHRQFGILVTTSFVHSQAYKEIREDQHPILIISGGDIVAILKRAGIRDSGSLKDWLKANFTVSAER